MSEQGISLVLDSVSNLCGPCWGTWQPLGSFHRGHLLQPLLDGWGLQEPSTVSQWHCPLLTPPVRHS